MDQFTKFEQVLAHKAMMLEEENENLKTVNKKLENDVKGLLDKTYWQGKKIVELKKIVKDLWDITSSPVWKSELYEDIKDFVFEPTWTW